MKESTYQKQVIKYLRDCGAYAEVISASAFQAAGIPDILACYQGVYIGLELKVGYNKPSPLQVAKVDMIRNAGGVGAIVWESLEPIEDIVDAIDLDMDNGTFPLEVLRVTYKYNTRKDSL